MLSLSYNQSEPESSLTTIIRTTSRRILRPLGRISCWESLYVRRGVRPPAPLNTHGSIKGGFQARAAVSDRRRPSRVALKHWGSFCKKEKRGPRGHPLAAAALGRRRTV